ncbi:MAG: GGDEF domain-containing protein [bacterium]|nr:GGDEF domain-containing protein [bacterium]
MNPVVLDLIRTRRRMLAAHWARDLAAAPTRGQIWQDGERIERQTLTGMDALAEAAATGQVEPFVEFAGRFSGEALALETPLEEVIRALLEVKPVVLDFLTSSLPAGDQGTEADHFLNRLISAGILEVIQRYERLRSRRGLAVQGHLDELRERARRQIIVNSPTGLYSATYFATAVQREMIRSRRFKRTFAVALVAADQEEEVDNTLGSEAARSLAVHLANILTHETRMVDLRAVLASGRFGLILPETSLEGAFALAERIRGAVERTSFVPPGHPYPLTITVSIGLACYPQDADTDQELTERAEEALARARAGQNTTVAAASSRNF